MEDGTEKVEIPEESPNAVGAATEENVPDLMPDMEHAHVPHGHGSGIHWLDMIVGLSAMFVSVVSLWVSIGHGKTMEKMVDQNQKMVEASTMPILSIVGRNLDDSGKPMLQVTLSNDGVGPAIIDRFEIRYKGVVYTDDKALLRACCAASLLKAQKTGHTKIYSSNASGFIEPARQDIYPITIKPDKDGLDLYNAFRRVRDSDDLTFHACYCSVLNECWETDFDRKRPQPVNKCSVSPNEKLW
jgi:hypothetical protein